MQLNAFDFIGKMLFRKHLRSPYMLLYSAFPKWGSVNLISYCGTSGLILESHLFQINIYLHESAFYK